MIVVIADDLSGAAELAGVALAHGLSAEVQTEFAARADADVVCVDTDSRSLTAADAAAAVARASERIAAARPAWVFKKCDSVLRGSVRAEAEAVLRAFRLPRALIVPANPSRGRVIRDGICYVAEQPLHETPFARDPEHPRTTSRVSELLGGPSSNWTAPDAASAAEVEAHAASSAADTLPVGGADFFAALLRQRVRPSPSAKQTAQAFESVRAAGPDNLSMAVPHAAPAPGAAPASRREATLLVCGSAASWRTREAQARAGGIEVFARPHDPAAMVAALRQRGAALIGIGEGEATHGLAPAQLVRELAHAVVAVVHEVTLDRLLLEGGATAAAVFRAMGWTRLRACGAPAAGVGVLTPADSDGLRLFIKPGSYPWPPAIWPAR